MFKYKRAGFTLIELLVVISILSVFSSLALAELQNAKIKAKNSQTISIVWQYFKAFETYHLDGNDWPSVSGSKCLADFPSDICPNGFPEDPIINSALAPYMTQRQGVPSFSATLILFPLTSLLDGPTYSLCSGGLSHCPPDSNIVRHAYIGFNLNGNNLSCGPFTKMAPAYINVTSCVAVLI